MEINRRALYNSLRMNWILDPTLEIEAWQVEDYRAMPLDALFEQLENKGVHLDKNAFRTFAEGVDTPEELTDVFFADSAADAQTQDQVYLLIFELWRRLLPEKPCVSVFCDEIDHQIHLFDSGQVENVEAIEDALANLEAILDENVDNGVDPEDAFDCFADGCANNIEVFLHDFIADQIDNENYSYATELLDGFYNYLHDEPWFQFERARVIAVKDPKEANALIKQIIGDKSNPPDLELNFKILSFLVANGEQEAFERLVKQTADLLLVEEDFQSLVSICADFYHLHDREAVEQNLQTILKQRKAIGPDQTFDPRDPKRAELLKIIAS